MNATQLVLTQQRRFEEQPTAVSRRDAEEGKEDDAHHQRDAGGADENQPGKNGGPADRSDLLRRERHEFSGAA